MGDDIGRKYYEVYALASGDPTVRSWDNLSNQDRNTWNAAAQAISGGGSEEVVNLDEYIAEWRKGLESSRSYNGAMDKYFDQIEAEWEAFIVREKPLFRAEYDAMTDAEKKKLGIKIWSGNFESGGRANTFHKELIDKYVALARADMEEVRKNYVVNRGKFKGKKWSGHNYLIAPNGTTKVVIGMNYPWHTRPDIAAAITENWTTRFRR